MPKSKGRRKPKTVKHKARRRTSPREQHAVDVAPLHPDTLEGHGLAAPPWEAYLWALAEPDAPPGTETFMERLPFRVRTGTTPPSNGYNDMTCLAEMAANAGQPVQEMCEFQRELAAAGFLCWDPDSQSVLLTVPDDAAEDTPALPIPGGF